MSAKESVSLEKIDAKIWLQYLEQICEIFRGEIPHVKHPKMDYAEFKQKNHAAKNSLADFARMKRIAAAKRETAREELAVYASSSGKKKSICSEKLASEF
jgi:F-actin monooxygenase